jgi:hypothetical protein
LKNKVANVLYLSVLESLAHFGLDELQVRDTLENQPVTVINATFEANRLTGLRAPYYRKHMMLAEYRLKVGFRDRCADMGP